MHPRRCCARGQKHPDVYALHIAGASFTRARINRAGLGLLGLASPSPHSSLTKCGCCARIRRFKASRSSRLIEATSRGSADGGFVLGLLQLPAVHQLDVRHRCPRRFPRVLVVEPATQRSEDLRPIIVERSCCAFSYGPRKKTRPAGERASRGMGRWVAPYFSGPPRFP
jgi:hypothetical protein